MENNSRSRQNRNDIQPQQGLCVTAASSEGPKDQVLFRSYAVIANLLLPFGPKLPENVLMLTWCCALSQQGYVLGSHHITICGQSRWIFPEVCQEGQAEALTEFVPVPLSGQTHRAHALAPA